MPRAQAGGDEGSAVMNAQLLYSHQLEGITLVRYVCEAPTGCCSRVCLLTLLLARTCGAERLEEPLRAGSLNSRLRACARVESNARAQRYKRALRPVDDKWDNAITVDEAQTFIWARGATRASAGCSEAGERAEPLAMRLLGQRCKLDTCVHADVKPQPPVGCDRTTNAESRGEVWH